MKAFHAYDIRGIYNEDFDREDVYRIGYYLPQLLSADRILIGRDVRLSSPEIFEALCKGILEAGKDVYDAGLCTTPMVYWATAQYGFEASVMITASHNPKEYNGLKISRKNALPVGYDSGLKNLEAMVLSGDPISVHKKKGKIHSKEIKPAYLEFQKQFLSDFSDLNITMDISNGMAGLLVKEMYGENPFYLNEQLDGNFPAHEPNPLNPKNIEQIQKAVIEHKSDLGVIYDGDADRVMFVDENARFISPDLMIALLGHYFLEKKGQKGIVLQDIRTSKAVGEYLRPMGAELSIWRVGRAYAALKLREIDGVFGGELAGHYYFRDFFYSDSAIMASSIILGIVADFKKKGISLSQIIDRIEKYANSGEINFKIEQKTEAMEAVKNHFVDAKKPDLLLDFDGYRIEYPDWWLSIRPSNTEPYLRLLVEAKTDDMLKGKVDEISKIIHSYS
jgi:phosphomannomutase